VKKKLLIIDDDEAIRELLASMLLPMTDVYDIYKAESGAKAIALARQVVLDHVFTDMQMPGLDGLETFRELKKLNPCIKVVLMTGFASQDRIDAALQEGAVDCLMKPFTAGDVKAILEKH
jgi:CheY-like chemotaxis protein